MIDNADHFISNNLGVMFESGSGTWLCGKDLSIRRRRFCGVQAASALRYELWMLACERAVASKRPIFFTSSHLGAVL